MIGIFDVQPDIIRAALGQTGGKWCSFEVLGIHGAHSHFYSCVGMQRLGK